MLIFANDAHSSPRACLLLTGRKKMHQYTDAFKYTLSKHRHTDTHTPPSADFSSSCSFLLGTLKPVHVSQCPSLQTPLSSPLPSVTFHAFLPLFHISVSVSDSSLHRVSYQIFHHVSVNKVKYNTPLLHLFFFSRLLLHHRSCFYLLYATLL